MIRVNPPALFLAILLAITTLQCTRPMRAPEAATDLSEVAEFRILAVLPTEDDLQNMLQKLEREPDNASLQFETAMMYQMLSPPDRWHYLDASLELLEAAQTEYAMHPGLLMYLGLVSAGRALNPKVPLIQKMGMARKGFRFMDESVQIDPDNFSLRLLRAKAELLAPAILGRAKYLVEDHNFVIENMDDKALNDGEYLMALIYLGDYEYLHKKNKALGRQKWQEAAALDSSYADVAVKRLERYQ